MKDTREFHRILLETDIEVMSRKKEKPEHPISRNISLGGICITTHDAPLVKHERYRLMFNLPGLRETIETEGLVVWYKERIDNGEKFYDNGIEFVRLKKEFREMIEDFSIGSVLED